MVFARVAVVVVAGLALAACAETSPDPVSGRPDPAVRDRAPVPGYTGPCPSPEAQDRLRAFHGRPVPVGVAGIEEPGWVLGGFSVTPSPLAPGGKGPVVGLMKDGVRREIHVPDDAAVDRLLAEIGKAPAPR